MDEKLELNKLEAIEQKLQNIKQQANNYLTTLYFEDVAKISESISIYYIECINELAEISEDIKLEISEAIGPSKTLRDAIDKKFPIGTIINIHKEVKKLSINWLFCDGKTYKKEQYPILWALCEHTNTEFTIPNLSKNDIGVIIKCL
ncbi:hypothetical protein AZF37_09725 (plasmid) [endosymbiont 'TC1' of Trimyema compressum]|uniref:tail fiber protein n=1 Tax=endosymbiont 'TC1' of Trimyema compressum TaxID=243899 RepID=UPI0007F161A1|nr:tail fiber protein [endosymbiont 'TC1' of Trimyema compressum]AMP21452.1 hypothetical protein AZF37_09725 [endosymbiont 'TC1' of Trimyema compressum]